MRRRPMRRAIALSAVALAAVLGAAAAPPPEASPEAASLAAPEGATAKRPRDPYAAYEAGLYDQALQGFRDRLARQPESAGLKLAEGGSAYKLGEYQAAEAAYQAVAQAQDEPLAEHALYNLGNTAYRQGRLEDAIRHYEAALGLDPEDEDARFNLDFVRRDLERRKQQQKQNQQQKGSQGEQQQPDPPQQGEDQQPQPGEQPREQERPGAQGADQNDPQQGSQHNGGREPRPEEEHEPRTGEQPAGGEQGSQAEEDSRQARGAAMRPMTQEEADRYLAMLEEGRPRGKQPRERAQRAKGGKDW